MADAPRQIRVSREWLRLLDSLPTTGGRLMLVGPSDAGKTTLCRWLVAKLQERAATAWVDADVGQSQVGPPACVGWRLATQRDYQFYFVGDVTPATRPLAAVTGTVRAVEAAEAAGAKFVVIDTTGYLQGVGGVALKNAKLDLLSPARLLALGDSVALKRLLAAWHHDRRLTIHRVPTAEALRQKTAAERSQWRRQVFGECFATTDLRRISLHGKMLSDLPTSEELRESGGDWSNLEGLLVGFHDDQRRGVALGLLQQLDWRNQQMLVRTTAVAEQAAGVIFGGVRLEADGSTKD